MEKLWLISIVNKERSWFKDEKTKQIIGVNGNTSELCSIYSKAGIKIISGHIFFIIYITNDIPRHLEKT